VIELKRYMSSMHMPMRDNWKQCITRAAESGFDGIELFGSEYEDESKMEKGLFREYARLSGEVKIQLSAHPWMEWSNLPQKKLTEKLQRLLEYCASMEMKEVNIHLAFLTSREQGMDRLFTSVDQCISFLREHKMTLLFENVPAHGFRELGSEVADFDALFAHYSSDSPVMSTIDTGHAHIEKTIETLAVKWPGRWRYTHIHDNNGLEDLHRRPGQGTLDWNELARCARKAGYTGPLMMEYSFSEVPEAMPVLTQAFNREGFSVKPLIK
jgi:sugar phosphate isomerase/epimerase